MSENIAKDKKENPILTFFGSYIGKLVIAIILLCVIMSMLSPYFFRVQNFLDILNSTAITGIIAFGMTLVIITGSIDLSVGAVVALTSVSVCYFVNLGLPPYVAVLVAFAFSAMVGFVNSFFVSKMKINAFIITMGTMNVARGLAYIIIGGRPKPFTADSIRILGTATIFGVPVSVLFLIVGFIIVWYLLKYTQFGRNVYAVGNNKETARLSGINVLKTQTMVFVISALLCAVAGLLLTAKAYAGIPAAGEGYEMDAITAVVLGGAPMEGGSGTVIGTLIGAIIVAIVMNGMNLLSVPHFYQLITKGIIVIVAMVIAQTRTNK